jgi:hypothetical protein
MNAETNDRTSTNRLGEPWGAAEATPSAEALPPALQLAQLGVNLSLDAVLAPPGGLQQVATIMSQKGTTLTVRNAGSLPPAVQLQLANILKSNVVFEF